MFKNIFKRRLKVSSILTMMKQHIESFNKDNLNYDYESELNKLKKEYKELEDLGLTRTTNAKNIRCRINFIYSDLDQLKLNKIFSDFIFCLSKQFDPKVILISYPQFLNLCKKYKLKVDNLWRYSGFIPDYALQSIKINRDKIKHFRYKEVLNTMLVPNTNFISLEDTIIPLYKITEVSSVELSDYPKTLKDCLNKQYNIVKAIPNKFYPNRIDSNMLFQYNKNLPKASLYYINRLHIEGYRLNSDNLFIAYSDIKFKKSSNTNFIDCFVFQISPFGVIIYSIWSV